MNYENYLENVTEKLSYNFDIIENPDYDGVKFNLAAKSNIRNEKYIALKSAVIYAYENNEYCFFKILEDVNFKEVDKILEVLKKAANDFVEPHDEHMSTTFTGIIITQNPLESDLKEKILKFKHQKSHKFGFHGWTSVRVVVVELSTGKVIASKEAKNLDKFYAPII